MSSTGTSELDLDEVEEVEQEETDGASEVALSMEEGPDTAAIGTPVSAQVAALESAEVPQLVPEEQVQQPEPPVKDVKDLKEQRDLRVPPGLSLIASTQFEWTSKTDSIDEEPTHLLHFETAIGGLSWDLVARLAEEDLTSFQLQLLNVKSDNKPDNLCIKIDIAVTTRQTRRDQERTAHITKLLNADADIEVLSDYDEDNYNHFTIAVSTFYRTARFPPCAACADWGRVRECLALADVTFEVDDEEVLAHKLVLCARSPVFMSMFTLDFKESADRKVKVVGVTTPVFVKFLEFLYSGRVQDFEGLELQVMIVADRYQVWDLKELCQQEMFHKVDMENVLVILELAENTNALLLKQNALAVAVDNIAAIMASESWAHFHAQHNDLVDAMLKETILRNTAATAVV